MEIKVDDIVKMTGNEDKTWRVIRIKSDRGFWIQIDDVLQLADVWHNSSYFEVIS
jgi:hypothetical protein